MEHCVGSAVLGVCSSCPYLAPPHDPRGTLYYHHFTSKETKAWRGLLTCSCDDYNALTIYIVPGIVLSTSSDLSQWILLKTQWDESFYSIYFTNEEIGSLRGQSAQGYRARKWPTGKKSSPGLLQGHCLALALCPLVGVRRWVWGCGFQDFMKCALKGGLFLSIVNSRVNVPSNTSLVFPLA